MVSPISLSWNNHPPQKTRPLRPSTSTPCAWRHAGHAGSGGSGGGEGEGGGGGLVEQTSSGRISKNRLKNIGELYLELTAGGFFEAQFP